MNTVQLIGNLTRDCELKHTQSGTAICNMSIAVNEKRKVGESWEDHAHFFDLVLWGRRAEALAQYLTRGKKIGVAGKLQQDRWEQDGKTRSRVKVLVNEIDLLSSGNGGQSGGDHGTGNYQAPADSSQSYGDDDIPF